MEKGYCSCQRLTLLPTFLHRIRLSVSDYWVTDAPATLSEDVDEAVNTLFDRGFHCRNVCPNDFSYSDDIYDLINLAEDVYKVLLARKIDVCVDNIIIDCLSKAI